MLAASIHEHAGLGNQIWRYVCCRVFAENLGYDFGVSNPPPVTQTNGIEVVSTT